MKERKIILIDNSTLSDFKKCPMSDYLRHQRGMKVAGTSPALGFGSAIHKALEFGLLAIKEDNEDKILSDLASYRRQVKAKMLEHVKQEHYASDALPERAENLYLSYSNTQQFVKEVASTAFTLCWHEEGMPSMEEMAYTDTDYLKQRNPGVGYDIIDSYFNERWDWLHQVEILAVEIPILIPIPELSNEKQLVCLTMRLDGLVRDRGRVWILEHKTSSLYGIATGFQQKFTNSFKPNSQIDTYLYGGTMRFPDLDIAGVYVDGILVHKQHRRFILLQEERTTEDLKRYYAELLYWANIRINGFSDSSIIPRNVQNCVNVYGFCSFHDFCQNTPTPETDPFPIGFEEDYWEPFNYEETKILLNSMGA